MYVAVLGVGLLVARFAWLRSWQPYVGLSAGVLLVTWLAWVVRPRVGLNLTLFLALIGDTVTISWFPFNKNLSSHESIFWISDGFSMSPLEMTILLALVVVFFRRWTESQPLLARGDLLIPLLLFLATVFVGFGVGLGRGGDFRIALFEARPLLYFPLVFILANSVCEQAKHYRHLLYSALAAIVIQSLLSARVAYNMSAAQRASIESLTEHGSSIGINLLLVTLILSFAFKGSHWAFRSALLVGAIPAVWVYLLSQRRVAFVALTLAFGLFSIILFWRQRRTFWKVVPIVSLIGLAYVLAFWNSDSSLGFPAQAIKTVIAPDELTAKDQSSDQYRLIENFNLQATIRSSPLLGLGFGQAFLRPVPLPNISSFEFHEYIPHNSLLWVWVKTGIVGMVGFLYVIARAIVGGVDRVKRQAIGVDFVVSVAGLFFVAMFAMYVFADIAWEPRNSVLLGVCLALCTSHVGLPSAENDTDERPATATNVSTTAPPLPDAATGATVPQPTSTR